MGTNYYLHEEDCPCCGRERVRLHIGKSSAGHCFALHVIPEIGLNNFSDWQKRWNKKGAMIFNEYGHKIDPEKMKLIILDRKFPSAPDPMWFHDNKCQPGPNNLARSIIDWVHCIGHGNGTYDLIQGDFS